jgi:hypothetical protein
MKRRVVLAATLIVFAAFGIVCFRRADVLAGVLTYNRYT